MPIHCPHCDSPHTQRLRAIYDAGTADSSGSVSATGYSGSHPTSVSGGYRGVSQTRLAQKAAPPETRMGVFTLPLVAGLIAFPFAALGACVVHPTVLATVVLVAVLAVPFGIANTFWNWTRYPALRSKWRQTWYCHTCGERFVHT